MKELMSKVTNPASFLKAKLANPADFIQTGWEKLSKLPGGNVLFSKLAGKYIPYTGSVSPIVEKIANGAVVVSMKDRRPVRNHLDSIHALALANLGEFTTGLSVYSQLKNKEKAILVKLETEYLKKARGELRGETSFQLPESFQTDTNFPVKAEIKDENNEVVTRIVATWRVRL